MPAWLTGLANAVPWPLPVRPSLEALADPEARDMLAMALTELGIVTALAVASLVTRRGRVPLVLVALVVAVSQGPSLSFLFVAAYPTSFRPSPSGFTAASIVEGRGIFASACVSCHGVAGDGAGGKGVAADLRRRHIWEHLPGDLFWFVSHGVSRPDGGVAMPGFAAVLPEGARWAVIDYVRALNLGSAVRGLDGWPHRVMAPDLALRCARLPARSIADLRGKAIHLILGEADTPPARLPTVEGVETVTVVLGEARGTDPPDIDCRGSQGAEAYAILGGMPGGETVQARFLVDAGGVLRSIRRKDDGEGWADSGRLLADLRTICTAPLRIEPGDDHEHRR